MAHRIRRRPNPDGSGPMAADRNALNVTSEMKRALRQAHFEREFSEPVRTGTMFVRVGVMSHQMRLIALDTIIRQFVSSTTIEYFDDDSVRFYIAPKAELVLGVVRHDLTLRRYCAEVARQWLYLLSPLCERCARPFAEHVNDQCLFQSTSWHQHVPDDEQYLYRGFF